MGKIINSTDVNRVKYASDFNNALCIAVSLIPEFGIDVCCDELGPVLQKMMRSDATLQDARLMLRSADEAVKEIAAVALKDNDEK